MGFFQFWTQSPGLGSRLRAFHICDIYEFSFPPSSLAPSSLGWYGVVRTVSSSAESHSESNPLLQLESAEQGE